ncbi:MAG: PDZ domain-containing protein [Actinomycetota bacterium]|jgi:PDZ domain-containing protein|nr:PDZ domain-containing protein [Actinomycetota bacterium]
MRLLRLAFLPLSVVILGAAATTVPLPLYVEEPGTPVSLADCVTVDSPRAGQVMGDYLLTTVDLLEATVVDVIRGAADAQIDVVERSAVIPAEISSSDFFDQQEDLFAATADVAAAVGQRAAGLETDIRGDGVLVVGTVAGTPAAGLLAEGDVITAVDAARVRTDVDLRQAIEERGVGEAITVAFLRERMRQRVQITPQRYEGRPVIGVQPQTLNLRVDLAVPVAVASGNIGGPSAGLMIAMTVYDKIDTDVDLAAGRRIAGTGTIDTQGSVGQIGGIRQKVVAADRGGAHLFLAPAEQLDEARSVQLDGEMQVVGVDDFDSAVDALRRTAAESESGAGSAVESSGCPYEAAA